MAKYTEASVERVREAVDMVDLVASRTELKRSGANRLEGLCPFHDERTPSFGIDPGQKLYHCFGCGAGGDAIRFVQETEGLSFREAIELLADRYRVELELEDEDPRDAERRARRARLYELLERTATFYVRVLWESREAEAARAYLAERGLEEGVLREFRVGFSPQSWDKVLGASRRAGFTDAELLAAGLAQRRRDGSGLYDRFRGRIMFPLADLRGRVLGFGARGMTPEDKPKYLNTAEGELYHKGRQLFAADLARGPAAKAGSTIVAEGYTDVIALHQAGLRNAVGIMGTSLTEEQVAELARMAPVVNLALDADAAGQNAMLRAARVAAGRKVELRVVPLPRGADPADLVRSEGAEAVAGLVERSLPFVRFRVERALEGGDLSSAEGKDRVLEELRPVFAGLPASVMREQLLQRVADRLDITAQLAASLLPEGAGRTPPAATGGGSTTPESAAQAAPPGERPEPRSASTPSLHRGEATERAFLALCIAVPQQGAEALAEIDPEEYFASPLARRAAQHLREHLDRPTEGLGEEDAELHRLLTELSVRAAREPALPVHLEVERLQLERARLERRMAALRAEGGGTMDMAAERGEIQRRLDDAIARAVEAGA